VEELFPYWEELGKALYLEEQFLQEIFDQFPMDPAERLRIILRKWRDTTDHPSLATLDNILEQFKDGVCGRNSKEIIVLLHIVNGESFPRLNFHGFDPMEVFR